MERVLGQAGYEEVAKAYILYRKQREKMRTMKSTILDYKDVVNSYVKVEDWRVKENSTVTYSVGGLILSNSGAVTANYWLSEIYDEEIAEAHRNADIHIHDLSMLTGYCAGWSLKQLIKEGLGGITGKITSAPARHLSVLCNQMVNFLGIMQNEWAGAQAFSSFDTYLAPFVRMDKLGYNEVKHCVESFVYGVNTPSRWGTQAPFSNITLDWTKCDYITNVGEVGIQFDKYPSNLKYDVYSKDYTQLASGQSLSKFMMNSNSAVTPSAAADKIVHLYCKGLSPEDISCSIVAPSAPITTDTTTTTTTTTTTSTETETTAKTTSAAETTSTTTSSTTTTTTSATTTTSTTTSTTTETSTTTSTTTTATTSSTTTSAATTSTVTSLSLIHI